MLRVVPLQVDYVQVGLPDSETPGGAGYLGKEERAGRGGGEEGSGRDEENKKQSTSMKALTSGNHHAGLLLSQSPAPILDGVSPSSGQDWLRLFEWKK